MPYFTELVKTNSRIYMEPQKSLNSYSNLDQKKTKQDALLYLTSNVLQLYSNKNSLMLAVKQRDQWNRMEHLEVSPHI
jgi:hypothetical protein